jgi:hypothetical protein
LIEHAAIGVDDFSNQLVSMIGVAGMSLLRKIVGFADTPQESDDSIIWLTAFQQTALIFLHRRLAELGIADVKIGGRPAADKLTFGHHHPVLIVVLSFERQETKAWIYDDDAMFITGSGDACFERPDYESDEALAAAFVEELAFQLSEQLRRER